MFVRLSKTVGPNLRYLVSRGGKLSFDLKRPISSEPNARWRIAALIAASTAAYTDVVQAEKEDSSFCRLNCKYTLGKACNEDIETMVNFGHARMKTLCISDKGIEVCKRLIGNSSAAVEVTKGRFHLWLNTKYNQFLSSHKPSTNDCKEDEWKYAVREVDRQLKNFINEYFVHNGFPRNRYVMTQLQLLVSNPGSENQFFHVDNTACGLTFVIALDDISMDKGPTELLHESYCLHNETGAFLIQNMFDRAIQDTKCDQDHFSRKSKNVSSIEKYDKVHATLKKGQIFVFDSRK